MMNFDSGVFRYLAEKSGEDALLNQFIFGEDGGAAV